MEGRLRAIVMELAKRDPLLVWDVVRGCGDEELERAVVGMVDEEMERMEMMLQDD